MTGTGEGALRDLDEDACWALLAEEPVGRLVWTGPEGPTAVPVNYTVDSRTIAIRTTAYSSVARETDDSVVAFEVDHVDAEQRTGWSVLVRGRAEVVSHRPGAGTTGADVDVWPTGARPLRLVVHPTQVTGRRLG